MMIVLLIIGILCVAMTPVSVRMFKKDEIMPEHGSFECYYDSNGTLRQVLRDENGDILSRKTVDDADYCTFNPNAHSLFFLINAVSGGSGGAGSEDVFKSVIPNNGQDYLDSYIQHKDYIFGLGSTVSFSDYNNSDWSWVYDKLNEMGIPIIAILTSSGGGTKGSIQVAFNNRDREGCNVANPAFNSPDCTGEKCCYTYNYRKGINGAYGARYSFYNMNAIEGTSLSGQSNVQEFPNTTSGVSFFANNAYVKNGAAYTKRRIGCMLQNGDDGCYYYPNSEKYTRCYPSSHTPHNYTGGYKCTDVLSYTGSSTSGGYPHTAAEQDDWFDSYNSCNFSTCQLDGSSYDGSSDCSMNFCSFAPAYTPKAAVQIFGNAALISRKLNNGVNFYAQGGNPGNYRTMYISKFKHNLVVKPGKGGASTAAGGDTILKYVGDSDSDALMVVKGGKAPSSTNSVVAGRHFEISSTKATYEDKDFKSGKTYGDYFGTKEATFVYPIISEHDSVPSTVGNSGRGGYSIFRTTGASDLFTLKFNGNTYTNAESGTSVDKTLYKCTNSDQKLEGLSKFCVGNVGEGGAVVITW